MEEEKFKTNNFKKKLVLLFNSDYIAARAYAYWAPVSFFHQNTESKTTKKMSGWTCIVQGVLVWLMLWAPDINFSNSSLSYLCNFSQNYNNAELCHDSPWARPDVSTNLLMIFQKIYFCKWYFGVITLPELQLYHSHKVTHTLQKTIFYTLVYILV